MPPWADLDDNRVDGQGIRLLRHFADALEYQVTLTGNRLSIGFSSTRSAVAEN